MPLREHQVIRLQASVYYQTIKQNLFELIWKCAVVSQDWKDANIILLFVKGSRVNCANYRTISVL